MQVNRDRVRKLLKSFNFEQLFLDELGWNECDQSLPLRLSDSLYELNAIAQKRKLIAYVCSADSNGKILDSSTRGKIDTEVTKFSREHLIIFVDRCHQGTDLSRNRKVNDATVSVRVVGKRGIPDKL